MHKPNNQSKINGQKKQTSRVEYEGEQGVKTSITGKLPFVSLLWLLRLFFFLFCSPLLCLSPSLSLFLYLLVFLSYYISLLSHLFSLLKNPSSCFLQPLAVLLREDSSSLQILSHLPKKSSFEVLQENPPMEKFLEKVRIWSNKTLI